MSRSNCIFFAYALWWHRWRKGKEAYVSWRMSRWGMFPHVLYSEMRESGHLRCVSYVPLNPRHKPIPPPSFQGRVKWGDRTTTEGST